MRKIRLNKKETLLYIIIWILMFLSPIASLYFHSAAEGSDMEIKWNEVLGAWYIFAAYLVIFLIHNFILAPLLIYRHKNILYIGSTACLIAIFGLWQCLNRPIDDGKKKIPGPRIETMNKPAPPDMDKTFGMQPPPKPANDMHRPPEKPVDRNPRPMMMGQVDVIGILVLVGLLGLNLGIKLYFKNERDQKNFAELEKKNLNQQLEYLKYQINPHFFMNTLNNIHALVDIDPERAKTAIVELSKMMRYVLYDGNKSLIPLDKEVTFLQNYIRLMMLRYTDNVSVDIDIPDNLPTGDIPPLMLITFVENAFKHGVSYEKDSFINISMDIDNGKLLFVCLNSKAQSGNDEMPKEGGVGLRNVKQRLELIYGSTYTLEINDGENSYEIKLTIPCNPPSGLA